ncbi:hypothetical protein K491DRAFT_679800 [Lophiostoma macrostomum CBS 122681]|uniref:Autophagy protein n=1 Tax=Lophiostoma macrostomum CBS 122681 TaxID=1314788 RepID=A0A6A6T3U5_9PLEO|nr:hypothetical protein K491DRAFT_679800 [Lophiostoma macrostomum CBS 122681]
MGWLWSGSSSSSSAKDQLDPSLRDFLDREAPSGQRPSLPSKPAPKPSTPAQQEQLAEETAPLAPSQSQFQDGRYAHLWKNYTPQDILEDRSKSEQDKLRDIIEAYNDRKKEVGQVAMENCAFEYMEQYNCFKNPGFVDAITLCRAQTRVFNRCYETQAKFLKALGYLTMDTRSPEDSERIQMHADRLWQQLKEQEALIEKAKEEGQPLPKFESVLSRQNVARAVAGGPPPTTSVPVVGDLDPVDRLAETDVWANVKPEARQQYEKKLAELPPERREIERQALLGELRANNGIAKQVEVAFIEERINRMKRREAGQATIGDTIKRLWGWN